MSVKGPVTPFVTPIIQKDSSEYRDYTNAPTGVSLFYRTQHELQNFEFVTRKKEEILNLNRTTMSVFDAALKLNELIDESDPDLDLPQIVHLVQTAESIRGKFPETKYDWFHLVGFIHDLGKVLSHPNLFNEPQWAVVGDTFPVGCQYSDKIVYSEYFKLNSDYNNPLYNTMFGIYKEGIGFDNVQMSWGHDEYMYQVCVRNGSLLPPEALYIIRYHSFYSWHQGQGYDHLANDFDRKMLSWLREFQKCDLYSKQAVAPNLDEILPYYKALIEKYFPKKELNW